eukprot:5182681-Pyramimonas_sp.AAC.1
MAGPPLWQDDWPPGCRASPRGKAFPRAPRSRACEKAPLRIWPLVICPRSHSTNAPSVQRPLFSKRIPEA